MRRHGRIFETRFEVREDEQGPLIVGHGAVFNVESVDLGGWREIIAPGAFRRTLRQSPDVLSFFNHNASQVLGRTTSGTLTVSEDLEGLAYQVRPPDTTWARDLVVSMRRGDIRGSSFMFEVVKQSWGKSDVDGADIRAVHEVKLYEVGPVTFPAYPAADSSVRTLLDELGEESGLDFRALSNILARHRDGADLRPDDRELLVRAVDQLRDIIPALPAPSDPPQAGHSLDLLRRRLELVARS
jgi:uncharacterized protein